MSRIGEKNFESVILQTGPESFLRQDLSMFEVIKLSLQNSFFIFVTLLANKLNFLFSFNFIKVSGASQAEIAGFGLGSSFCVIICFAVIWSMCMGTLSRMSQAYGDNAHRLIGYYLHRGMILHILTIGVISIVMVYTDKLFELMNYEADLAYYTHEYLIWCIPGCVAYSIFTTLQYYLVALNNSAPPAYMQIITSPIYIGSCYYFVVVKEMGVQGSGIALGLQYFSLVIMIIGYIWYKRSGLESLFFPDKKSFQQLWNLFVHEIVVGSACFLSWIGYEIVGMMVGVLGEDITAGYMATATVMNIAYQIPVSLDNATITYVASSMGCKNTKLAKKFIWANLLITLVFSLIVLLAFWLFWPQIIPNFVSTDDAEKYSEIMIHIYYYVLVFDHEQIVLGAVVRAIEKSNIGFAVTLISNYVIYVPLALILCFHFDYGLEGLNWGYNVGLYASFFLNVLILVTADYELQSDIICRKIAADKHLTEDKKRSKIADSYHKLMEEN